MLLPLKRKTREHTSRAVEQLMEYDKADSFDKWILVNWQKPPYYHHDDALSQKFQDFISKVNGILKLINPKLRIHVL